MCKVKAKSCGDWPVKLHNTYDEWVPTMFKNVLVCELIPGPIISEKQMCNWGHDILSRDKVVIVLNTRTQFEDVNIPTVEGRDGLTYLLFQPESAIHTEHCALLIICQWATATLRGPQHPTQTPTRQRTLDQTTTCLGLGLNQKILTQTLTRICQRSLNPTPTVTSKHQNWSQTLNPTLWMYTFHVPVLCCQMSPFAVLVAEPRLE
eukprot:1933321-Rhodomonas_salina.1